MEAQAADQSWAALFWKIVLWFAIMFEIVAVLCLSLIGAWHGFDRSGWITTAFSLLLGVLIANNFVRRVKKATAAVRPGRPSRRDRTVGLACGREEGIRRAVSAMTFVRGIFEPGIDPASGTMVKEVRPSWTSSGEVITVHVTAASADACCVRIESRPLSTLFVAYGENGTNIDRLAAAIRNEE